MISRNRCGGTGRISLEFRRPALGNLFFGVPVASEVLGEDQGDEGDEEDGESQRFHQPLIRRRPGQVSQEHRGQGDGSTVTGTWAIAGVEPGDRLLTDPLRYFRR